MRSFSSALAWTLAAAMAVEPALHAAGTVRSAKVQGGTAAAGNALLGSRSYGLSNFSRLSSPGLTGLGAGMNLSPAPALSAVSGALPAQAAVAAGETQVAAAWGVAPAFSEDSSVSSPAGRVLQKSGKIVGARAASVAQAAPEIVQHGGQTGLAAAFWESSALFQGRRGAGAGVVLAASDSSSPMRLNSSPQAASEPEESGAPSPAPTGGGRARTVLAAALSLVLIAGGLAWHFSGRFLPRAGDDHDHAQHVEAHEAHDHENTVHLSRQAMETMGLKSQEIRPRTFERTIPVPAAVAEVPGKTRLEASVPAAGIVTKVHVADGEALKPGQALFDIRVTDKELVRDMKSLVQNLVELDYVRVELARAEKLYERNALSNADYLTWVSKRNNLEARIKTDEQALLQRGLSGDQVAGIKAKRSFATDLTVRAPEGSPVFVLSDLSVAPGQGVSTGQRLAVLTDYSRMRAVGYAYERDLSALGEAARRGWEVSAVSAYRPGWEVAKGLKIDYIASEVEPSRTVRFILSLPNRIVSDSSAGGVRRISWLFKPGMRLSLNVPVERWEGQSVLPASAVVQDGSESYVFLGPHGDHFHRVPVAVKYRSQEWVVVSAESLPANAAVVVSGAQQLLLALKAQSGHGVDPHAGHSH